jgi:glycosyltransferase involved in cell wall biosynthesis
MAAIETNPQNRPRISVVIPAYNIAAYINRAIDSVLRQSDPADEIIVVDDGSTDGTTERIKAYGPAVRHIYQTNAGLSAARNTGIEAARYEWIAFLDGDDEWLPDHLHEQRGLLVRNPHLGWSTANYLRCLCDENRQAADCARARARKLLAGHDYYESYAQAFVMGLHGHVDTTVVRRGILREAGMFLVGLRRAEDMDMFLRIACRHPQIGFVVEPMAIYHLNRPGSLSRVFTPAELYGDLLARQLRYAEQHGRRADFEPVARFLLRSWLRAMLFDGRKDDIRGLLARFDTLLPPTYKMLMRALTAWPGLTRQACLMLSRVVRTLRLRQRLERRPD